MHGLEAPCYGDWQVFCKCNRRKSSFTNQSIMRYILIVIVALCVFSNAEAQDYHTRKNAPAKARKYYKKGQQCAYHNDYKKAVKYFQKALKVTPDFIGAHLMLADSYIGLGDYKKAVSGFEKVMSIDADYNPKIYYSWGMLERKHKNYEKAAELFEQFLTYPQKSDKLKSKVENLLATSRFAAKAVKNPVPFNPVNLGENINSKLMEYSPSFTADGQRILYTVRVGGQEDFYSAEKENDKWKARKSLDGLINTHDNEGAQSLSADGRTLVYTACNRKGDFGGCDLYFAEIKAGYWTAPYNIGQPINSEKWESQPSISATGNELYFTSDRGGGKGKKDIWISRRNSNGTWSEPENLGKQINTSGDDISPFIHPDGQTLYFASDGHVGMGETDIFLSRRQADGSWGKAENIGYPINTEEKEFSLIVSTDGKTAYFSSDREEGFGLVDLYQFDLHTEARPVPVTYAKATVFDEKTKEKLTARVELIDLSTSKVHTKSVTDGKGEFLVVLPSGTDYALNVDKKGYLFHSENFALKEKNTLDEPYLLEIALQRIPPKPVLATTKPTKPNTVLPPKSKPVILKNVFFETASADLKTTSQTELNHLKDLLNEHPNIRIQINGHTDNVGAKNANLMLSENRAKAVFNYLTQNGISSSRLYTKGYGESQAIDTNDTPEGRANNRRTEFVIVD